MFLDNHAVRAGKRIEGEIVRQNSPSTFEIKDKNNIVQKRHVDQMISKEPVKLRRSPRLHRNND